MPKLPSHQDATLISDWRASVIRAHGGTAARGVLTSTVTDSASVRREFVLSAKETSVWPARNGEYTEGAATNDWCGGTLAGTWRRGSWKRGDVSTSSTFGSSSARYNSLT